MDVMYMGRFLYFFDSNVVILVIMDVMYMRFGNFLFEYDVVILVIMDIMYMMRFSPLIKT